MQTLPIANIEALAARRLSEQQIADVLDISLDELKKDESSYRYFESLYGKGGQKERLS